MPRPRLLRRRAQRGVYPSELVDVAAAREVGLAEHELGEDAPDGPHVHARSVGFTAQQQLGRSVPPGEDLMGPLTVGRAEDAREAEIRELEGAVGGDEKVVGLEIPVQDPAVVAVGHRLQGHGHVRFDLGRAERDELVLDDRLQVGLAALEDEVEVALVWEAVHELDDVRVPQLLQQLDLADRGEVDALSVLTQPDLLYRDNLLRERVLRLGHHAEGTLSEHRALDVPLLPRLGLAGLAILTHPPRLCESGESGDRSNVFFSSLVRRVELSNFFAARVFSSALTTRVASRRRRARRSRRWVLPMTSPRCS